MPVAEAICLPFDAAPGIIGGALGAAVRQLKGIDAHGMENMKWMTVGGNIVTGAVAAYVAAPYDFGQAFMAGLTGSYIVDNGLRMVSSKVDKKVDTKIKENGNKK